MKSDLVELTLEVKAQTGKAVKVKNLKGVWVWLPKSQIAIHEDDHGENLFDITVPEWLALDNELI